MNNKIRLIKSFANYPLGEYELNLGEYCCIKDGKYKIHPDIVEGMKDHFTEVKEKQRSRVEGYGYYRCILRDGLISRAYDNIYNELSSSSFDYGNYYITNEAARAVVNLRKHVYKFPMCKRGEEYFVYDFEENYWDRGKGITSFFDPQYIHYLSTEEDRAERLRLINEVIDKVGYLTI